MPFPFKKHNVIQVISPLSVSGLVYVSDHPLDFPSLPAAGASGYCALTLYLISQCPSLIPLFLASK